jgi:hypothetical protein
MRSDFSLALALALALQVGEGGFWESCFINVSVGATLARCSPLQWKRRKSSKDVTATFGSRRYCK